MKKPDIRFVPRYTWKDQDDKYVLAYDNKEGKTVLFDRFAWNAKKGFLFMVINGEIIP